MANTNMSNLHHSSNKQHPNSDSLEASGSRTFKMVGSHSGETAFKEMKPPLKGGMPAKRKSPSYDRSFKKSDQHTNEMGESWENEEEFEEDSDEDDEHQLETDKRFLAELPQPQRFAAARMGPYPGFPVGHNNQMAQSLMLPVHSSAPYGHRVIHPSQYIHKVMYEDDIGQVRVNLANSRGFSRDVNIQEDGRRYDLNLLGKRQAQPQLVYEDLEHIRTHGHLRVGGYGQDHRMMTHSGKLEI